MLIFRCLSKKLKKLIVSRGAHGISYCDTNKGKTIPAEKVQVVDTTGAGDTFNGVLASCLAQKINLQEAIKLAGFGASLSVTKLGAQTGMPTMSEIDNFKKYRTLVKNIFWTYTN